MNKTIKFKISPAMRERWLINNQNILESMSKDGYPVFKFCYDSKTGEFLFCRWPSNHKEIIEAYGKTKFDDYVRGIYFREKKIVYLRLHKDEDLLFQTKKFLIEHGVPNHIQIVWGKKAAEELAEELKGL